MDIFYRRVILLLGSIIHFPFILERRARSEPTSKLQSYAGTNPFIEPEPAQVPDEI